MNAINSTGNSAACFKCGAPYAQSAAHGQCRLCGSSLEDSRYEGVRYTATPIWERATEYGILRSLWRSIVQSLAAPSQYAAAAATSTNTAMAWIYALVMGSLGLAGTFFWSILWESSPMAFGGLFPISFTYFSYSENYGLYLPLYLTTEMVFLAAYCHIVLSIAGHGRAKAGATFRAVCYAQSAKVLAAAPIVGPPASFFWFISLLVISLKTTHHTSATRTVFALLLPAVIIGGILFMALAVLIGLGSLSMLYPEELLRYVR